MSPSTILLFAGISFLLGAGLGPFLPLNWEISIFLVLFPFFLLLSRKALLYLLLFLPFIFGSFWTEFYTSKIKNSPLKDYRGRTVELIAIVDGEPEMKEKYQRIKVKLEEGSKKILIVTQKSTVLNLGDEIRIKGKLEPIKGNYFLKDGIAFSIYCAEIEKIGKRPERFKNFLFELKQKTKERILHYLKRERGAYLLALLYGDESYFKKEEVEALNKSGTRHITAVSGMNITILTQIIFSFFLFLGFFRKSAFLITIFSIFLYLAMIGFPSSGVRAMIMAFLFLISQYLGRQSEGNLALVLAATIMVLLNPPILLFDLGFQLSFLAMLGIINLQEFFIFAFKKVPKFLDLRYNLATTISAQLFVLPILLYHFESFPLISPISNIFILPLLPFITVLGIIFLIFSFSSLLAHLLSFLLLPFLNYLSFFINLFSHFSLLRVEHPSFLFPLVSYFLLFYFTKKSREYLRLKLLGIL